MESVQHLQATLEYIEGALKEPLTIRELAGRAYLSPFYFHRLFRALVGTPVMEYIRLRRLAQSAEALRTRGYRIIDIAVEYGFGCHETYTRAFRAAYGLSPQQYRRHPVPLQHFPKPDLIRNLEICLQGGIAVEPRRVTRPELTILGMAWRCGSKDGLPEVSLPGLWERFFAEARHQQLRELTGSGILLGLYADHDEATGDFTYMVGTEVPTGLTVPDGLVLRRFGPAEYAVFESAGPVPLETCAQDFTQLGHAAYAQWLPTSGCVAGNGDLCHFEWYGEPDSEGRATVAIWLPVTRG